MVFLLPFLVIWLLFLPNAPYILTDLFHLKQRDVPLWYDLVTLLTFAWNGLFAGLISLSIMHEVVRKRYSEFLGWSFVGFSIFASAFGIFLGRYLRWNSWDIIQQPGRIFKDVLNPLLHPFENVNTVGMTLTFALLLFFIYSMVRIKENGLFVGSRSRKRY